MARYNVLGPLDTIIWLDHDTTLPLPTPAPLGQKYLVVDNLNLGNTVTLQVPSATGVMNVEISGVSGWGLRYTWVGNFYVPG